jgi:hypothetical protein
MKAHMNYCGSKPETIKALGVPAKPTTTIDSIVTSMRSMGSGSWAILAILLALLAGSTVFSYVGWTSAAGTDVPASGYVALALGVIFSLAVGFGLMALVFYSSRAGYDEPATLVQKDDASSDPRPAEPSSPGSAATSRLRRLDSCRGLPARLDWDHVPGGQDHL